jgi:hypothetical protein
MPRYSRSWIRTSLTVTLAAAVLPVAAGGSATAANAANATATPASTATVVASTAAVDLKIAQASGMVLASGKLFVATGDEVRAYSAKGVLLGTVAGQAGVSGLVATADGARVYAALRNGSAVSTIDAVTVAETGRVTGLPCATGVALAGAQLFVSYGCDQDGGAITRIDTVAGGDPVAVDADQRWYRQPRIAAVSGRLVAVQQGLTPAEAVSYAVDGTTVTRTAAAKLDQGDTLALSPDGTRVAASDYSPYGLALLDAATLVETGSLPTGSYPGDVAFSRDGSLLTQGLKVTYGANLYVFDAGTGTRRTTRKAVVPGQSATSVVNRSIVFSTGGDRVFSLVTGVSTGTVVLATSPTTPPAQTSVALTLKSPATYGAKLVAVASVPGVPSAKVAFTVASNGTTRTTTVTASTSGVATAQISAPYGGKVTARYAGDTRHTAATSPVRAYTAPSRTTLAQSGAYKTVGSVRYYRSAGAVKLMGRVAPAGTRTVTVTIEGYVGGRWVVGSRTTLATYSDGMLPMQLSSAPSGVTLRAVVRFGGDSLNRASVSSPAQFRIG